MPPERTPLRRLVRFRGVVPAVPAPTWNWKFSFAVELHASASSVSKTPAMAFKPAMVTQQERLSSTNNALVSPPPFSL